MTNFKISKQELQKEIRLLQERLEQTEQERDEWKKQTELYYKYIQFFFNDQLPTNGQILEFLQGKAENWQQFSDALASELEEVEQLLSDDKHWIEAYSSAAEHWRGCWQSIIIQRDQLLYQLRELFEYANSYSYVSKHLAKECADTEKLLEKYEQEDK